MTNKFLIQKLWDGAIECQIPVEYDDVALIRDVPNNQECFVDHSWDRSIIFEILQREKSLNDGSAAKFFFQNLADESDATDFHIDSIDNNINASVSPFLKKLSNSSVHVAIGTMEVSKFNESVTNTVRVYLCVIRLPSPHDSDILIVFNSPARINPLSSSSAAISKLQATSEREVEEKRLFHQLISSFEIKRTELFGGT